MTNTSTTQSKPLNIALWIAQIALAAMFLMAGFMKATKPIEELSATINWATDIPELMVRFIGTCEFLGALGLLLPSILRIKPILTPVAASGLVTVMLFAAVFHITRGEYPAIAFNLTLGLVAAFIAWGRFKKVPIQSK